MKASSRWIASAVAVGVFAFQTPSLAQTSEQSEPSVVAEPAESSADGELTDQEPKFVTSAIMQGLDKITARVSEFDAPIGETVHFGSFEIVAKVCEKTPPEEPPESTAFLEITDIRPDEPARLVFKGWMFASSPALSAVEHPVYDVWVTGCRISKLNADSASAPETDGTAETGETAVPTAQ